MTVLIADDSETVVQRLAAMLEGLGGIEIAGHARNVSETVTALSELKPDVMILDLNMPGGSGLDVLEHIKNDRDVPAVVVLTNCSGFQYRRKCLQLGVRYFFDKSGQFEELTAMLKGLRSSSFAD